MSTRNLSAALENSKAIRSFKLDGFNAEADILKNNLETAEPDLDLIRDLMDVLQEKRHELKRATDEVVSKMVACKMSADDLKTENQPSTEALRRGQILVNQAKRLIESKKTLVSTSSSSADCTSKKLPKIQLPVFKGESREWLQYWSQFKDIHEDPKIPTADKYQYLIQSTEQGSEAREIVTSFPISAENYPLAVKRLTNVYGRERMLVKVYVRDLLQLVIDRAQNKEVALSSLFYKLSGKLEALGTLGVTTDKCASVIYPLIESCLPKDVHLAWQRHPSCQGAAEGEEELKKLMEFLEKEVEAEANIRLACEGLQEMKFENTKPSTSTKERLKKSSTPVATAAGLLATDNDRGKQSCIFCNGQGHSSESCWKARSMSIEEKKKCIKEKNVCFKCLGVGHGAKGCKKKTMCFVCGKQGHVNVMCNDLYKKKESQRSIHTVSPSPTAPPDSPVQNTASQQNMTTSVVKLEGDGSYANQSKSSPQVLLQTLKVIVHGQRGSQVTRALIDTGSHKSYVLKNIAEKVGLQKIGSEEVIHCLFGGSETNAVKHKKYKIFLTDADQNEKSKCDFDVSDSERISGKLRMIPRGPWLKELRQKGIHLSDVGEDSSEVGVLIGADVAGRIMDAVKIELDSGPVAFSTRLGWTLMGKVFNTYSSSRSSSLMVFNMHVADAEIHKLWDLDSIGITDPVEKKSRKELEESAMFHFNETVRKLEDGRYEINLPWIEGHAPLPDNKDIAEKRLRSTTGKLKKDGNLEKYDELFKTWEEFGMIEEVPPGEINNYGHYLPHRAVYKENSATTPIRPVFDASCKTSSSPSLNDCMEKGPNLIENIPAIITRFRLGGYGIIADVKKAFQQISVCMKDRDYLRFLWWTNTQCDELKIMRHRRVVFGVSSSPFILGAVLNHMLNNCGNEHQETSKLLKKALYVDNVAVSVNSLEAAQRFQEEANQIMSASCFELRGWELGPQGPGAEVSRDVVPLLGLNWDTKGDTLLLDLSQIEKKMEGPVTKRKILSLAHALFDPLGFTVPFTILPKLLLQETWSLKIGWDSPVTQDIEEAFRRWRDEISLLQNLKIPRWVAKPSVNKENWSLHVFVDASQKAYAACIFLRVEGKEIEVHLLQAKSRVAPIKKVTIPRLELLSCGIGARLAAFVKEAMDLEKIPTFYWTDSSTAYYWIKNEGNWGVFVQRRVDEIRRLSNVDDWRHVPGGENPADLPSRGCKVQKLIDSRWWEGPPWLQLPEESWPSSNVEFNKEEIMQERRKTVVSSLNSKPDSRYENLVECANWEEMIKKIGGERAKAETEIMKIIQQRAFCNQDRKLKALPTFVDEDGIMRLLTRLLLGEFQLNFKKPIVLPDKCPVVTKLILNEHVLNNHAGTQLLLGIMREKYWIIRGRKTIRMALQKCMECRRFDSKKADCIMAPLPKERIQAERPFEITGVDMMGPLFLDDGVKVWIALFTCAVYRAVHLELVTSLSTEAFKNAFRRFIGRRGKPNIVYSDNGTNFTGMSNLLKSINWKKIEKFGAKRRIEWRFNPPTASWWGGFWERMVGIVKTLLRKVLGNASINFEELQTLLCDVEATVNQRPLTYISEDPEDLEALSPSLFLTLRPNETSVEMDTVDGKSLRQRWRYLQDLRESLRSRFRKEYLGQLASAEQKKETKLKVGDRVLVGHDNIKRIDWPMGKVEDLIKSKDGKIRVVKVKMENGIITRPIQRVYRLEADEEDSEELTGQQVERTTRSGRRVKVPNRLTYVNISSIIP